MMDWFSRVLFVGCSGPQASVEQSAGSFAVASAVPAEPKMSLESRATTLRRRPGLLRLTRTGSLINVIDPAELWG